MTADESRRTFLANLAVPGKFHVFNYVRPLLVANVLNRFYCSHKPKTLEAFSIDGDRTVNAPAKEYLVQLHGRLLPRIGYDALMPYYTRAWCNSVLKRWAPAPILHLLNQGGCSALIRQVRNDNSVMMSEAVNTHPAHRLGVLATEALYWGIKEPRKTLFSRERLIIEDAMASDVILCPSRVVKQSYVTAGFPADAIRTIPYAANLARFAPAPSREPRVRAPLKIISVGSIGLRKGQLRLLEALATFPSSAFELTLVGTVEARTSQLVSKYVGKFKHIERVPSSDMPSLLRSHDIYVACSLEEGLAVSICEAMACGLAVIATVESGAEELVDDGVDGLLFAATDRSMLREHLLHLRDAPDECMEIGRKAALAMQATHHWDQYADRLATLYNELSSSK